MKQRFLDNPAATGRDTTLVNIVDEYLSAIEAGTAPSRSELLSRHPDLAADLEDCLVSLDFIGQAATHNPTREDSTQETLGQTLGDYRILREVGRGGMGVVYEAEQLSLVRRVALKVLPFAGMLDARQLQRFKNEAQAAAALHHQNIVPIHGVGSDRGVHYYAMQFIDGRTLDAVIKELNQTTNDTNESTSRANMVIKGSQESNETRDASQLVLNSEHHGHEVIPKSPAAETQRVPQAAISTVLSTENQTYYRSVAQLGIQVADALQHAHDEGVLHRDIKPSNLILDGRGKVWITDFGLARIEADPQLTVTGDIVGTLRYMSPEQLAGKRVVDQRTDIYSLGVTLYELLTLEPALPQSDRNRLLKDIVEREPTAPRKLNREIPADLETIILKAISKQAADRYATASELADDLQRFLTSKPVQARRPGFAQHVGKWARRNWIPLTSVVVTLILALAVSVVMIARAYRSERDQRQIAAAQRDIAEQEKAAAVASLDLALGAVDKMYADVATVWLSSDTALSPNQRTLLGHAIRIYKEVVQQPRTAPAFRRVVAKTYYRMGRIHQRLGQYTDASEAFESALSIHEDLRPEFDSNNELRREQTVVLRELAEMYRLLGDFDVALNSLDRARRQTQRLASEFPDDSKHKKSLALNELSRASVVLAMGQVAEADRLVHSATQRLRELRKEDPRDGDLHFQECRCADLLAQVLFRSGRHADALSQSHTAIAMANRLRSDFPDHRAVVRLEAEFHQQCGVIHSALSQFEGAEKHLRRSLAGQRDTLEIRMSPVQWVVRWFWDQDFSKHYHEQPGRFCDYVNTQLLLAAALREQDRLYAAELVLGEAHEISQIMTDMELEDEHVELRFFVSWANSCAEVAQVLNADRPDEAARAQMAACAIWKEAMEKFPRITEFRSGVHGELSDCQWFQATFPEEDLQAAKPLQAVELGNASVFGHHTDAVGFFEAELWQQAIERFQQAAVLRKRDHAYDWFYLAMANWQLGEHGEARRWFNKANQAKQREPSTDSELEALRDRAAALLNEQVEDAAE